MVFVQDVMGTEDFENIKKSWEKFVKVGEKFVKDRHFLAKTAYFLRKIWTILGVFWIFGEISFKVWSWGVVNGSGVNLH